MIILMITVMLFSISCKGTKENTISREMRELESIIGQHDKDNRLRYLGNCMCYMKMGYIGEGIISRAVLFDLKNTTQISRYEHGGIEFSMDSPDSVDIEVVTQVYEEQRYVEMLAYHKDESMIRFLGASQKGLQEQVYQHFKKAALLCGATLKEEYITAEGERITVE